MGLDVKNMQVCIWRVVQIFCTSCSTFTKKYPVVSGVMLFFFLLYILLPPVFTFLIYSLPILAFIVVVFRLIFRIHQQNLRDAKGETRNYEISSQKKPTFVEDDLIVENSSTQPLPVRRRNAKEKDKQVYHAQEGEEEKDMVFSTITNDDLVDKAALIDENPKEIREVKVDSVTDCAESLFAASQQSRLERGDGSEGMSNKFNGGGGELEVESSEDAEDDDEEEAQEDGNKAVEWTEVDQKNLMDLGISEMERNKRLESLIAKRRARKLLSIQVRRTLMNMGNNDPRGQLASILIPKINQFPPNSSGEAPISPIPGSAPSVLLPMHNPFDLPYDPEEEKPNLTGDNFDEEIMAAHPKDMMFCRHESFSLGAFFPGPGEFDQSRRETFYCPNFASRQRVAEIPEYSGLRKQPGKEDPNKPIQTESSQESESMLHTNSSPDHVTQGGQASEHEFNLVDIRHEKDRSEVDRESNLVIDVSGESSSSSSSELNIPFSAANKDQILKSLSFSIRKNIAVDRENSAQRNELLYDGIPSSHEKKRQEERFFCADKGFNHTRTQSIASDLQVEVSDIGSPTLTVDETISPSDGEHLMYDGDTDVEKETTSGNEEMWVASSQLSRVEENESRSREVHEVSQQDVIDVGFSRNNQKLEDPVASGMLPEKVVEQDSIDTSVSSSKIELPESSQTHSTDFNGKVHDEVQSPSACSSEELSTENLASSTLENAQQSTEKSEACPSHCINSGKPEERSDSPEKSAQEEKIIYDMNDQVVFANDDKDILEFIKDTYGEASILTKQEDPRDLSVLAMNDTKPDEITEGNSGVPESDHSKSTEYIEGEFKRQSDQGSNLIGNKNIQDRKGEQDVVDVEYSGANQNSNDPIASVIQPEIMAEEGPIDSSSSLSPTSVTEDKVRISQGSQSDFDQTTQTNVHQLSADMIDDNFLDKPLPESSNLTVSQDGLHLTEGSVTYLSNDTDPEKPQEPSNPPKKSTQELNSIYSGKDSEVRANCDKRNLVTIDNINIESHIWPNEANAGVLSKMPEERISKSIDGDYIEGQSEKRGENETILESYKPTVNDNNLKTSKDYEGEYLQIAECDNIAETSNSIGNNILESTQECEQATAEDGISVVSPSTDGPIAPVMLAGTVECGLYELNQSFFSDPTSPALLPEMVVEPVPIASSSSSSPKSAFQKKILINQASISSFDQETHMGVQQSETEMEENNLLNELPPENLAATVPQNALHLTEDSTIRRCSGNLQEPPSSLGKSTKQDGVNYNTNNSANNGQEPSKADPGRSIEEANIISNENELVLNVMASEDIRYSVGDTEDGSQRLMRSVDLAEQSENADVADSITIENDEGKSKKLTEAEETRILIDHENVMDLSKAGQGNDSFEDHIEKRVEPNT